VLAPAVEALIIDPPDPSQAAPEVVNIAQSPLRLPHVSTTFHGRDLFVPVAAHLAAGAPLLSVGEAMCGLVPLPLPEVRRVGEELLGAVIRVDRFGNGVTNIDEGWFREWPADELEATFEQADTPAPGFDVGAAARAAGREGGDARVVVRGLSNDYVSREGRAMIVRAGQPPREVPGGLLVVGSSGALEVSVSMGSAQRSLGIARGWRCRLRRAIEDGGESV